MPTRAYIENDRLEEGAPSGASELKAQLDAFLLLPRGWDSYDGCTIDPRCVEKAKELAEVLPGKWSACPCPDGTVQLGQYSAEFEIEIDITASNVLLCRARHGHDRKLGALSRASAGAKG